MLLDFYQFFIKERLKILLIYFYSFRIRIFLFLLLFEIRAYLYQFKKALIIYHNQFLLFLKIIHWIDKN